MFKNISILLSVPAPTNTRAILDQMKHLVETLERMYKDEYCLSSNSDVIGSIKHYVYNLRASGLYERFDGLVKMIQNVPADCNKDYTLLVNRYRAVRACIHIGCGGDTKETCLLDDFH
jgi:hypothetical protein